MKTEKIALKIATVNVFINNFIFLIFFLTNLMKLSKNDFALTPL